MNNIKKVLIAGGTGFAGQNTAKLFADGGTSVVVTSRKDNDVVAEQLKAHSDLISVAKVDLADTAATERLFDEHQFDGAIQLTQTHQHASSRKEINSIYGITLNFLESARASGVQRVILGSSLAVYGGLRPPFSEDVSFPPEIIFSSETPVTVAAFEVRAKRIVEQLFLDYATPMGTATSAKQTSEPQHELEVAILRICMQLGPGYRYAGNPVSIACHVAAGKLTDLASQIGYKNAPVPKLWNGLGKMPMLYIKDTASAFATVMAAQELPRTIYNIHSNIVGSPREQYQAILDAAGPNEHLNIPAESLDVAGQDLGYNYDRMREDFGWEPSYSLDEAVEEYIDWLREHDV